MKETPKNLDKKRADEKLLVSEMIALYCRKQHKTPKGQLCPACQDYMLGSHASEDPASRLVLSELGLRPFLYAGMRLGEGTGAVAVMPLLDMGLAVYREMATFEDTNIEAYQPLG